MSDRLLRPRSEVAPLLGVSPSTIYRWFREGRLSGIKIGKQGTVRIFASCLPLALRPDRDDAHDILYKKRLLNLQEAAAAMGIKKRTLHRMIDKGVIKRDSESPLMVTSESIRLLIIKTEIIANQEIEVRDATLPDPWSGTD